MSDKIRWGLLSTANINDALIEPIRQAGRSELVAVASRSLDKAQAYAQEKGIPKAHGSYEELLADPNIDVIYNPLPNTLHCEWTVKAAEAGKHVLCEKPISPTLAELDQIEAAAKANRVTVFEAFMYLHHPQTLQVKEIIQSGQLGNVQLINSWFAYYLPPEDSHNIRLNPNLAGGALWDVGVYPNSLAIVMAGAGAPVGIWASQIKGETGVDVSLIGQMKFANGVIAQISCGFRTPFREGVHIVGDKGIIQIIEPWKPGLQGKESQFVFIGRDDARETLVVPAVNPYSAEVAAMEACILGGAEPVVPLSLSRDFLRSVLALYESAETGRMVTL
ncbi:MAG TPA: Gfo/Idh/MocA family oxidoreductase [Anaerolineae bacterium]|nr:Gfo/Idh/MocA family oxidoreductase [Anaerolineae bacterium]HXV97828.1 Gfo/Idh/MocA family oxidoreductase [Anaerolineae bacterium]